MIYLLILCLVGIDQLTKYLTVEHIANSSDIILIKNVIDLTYIENTGAAFSMLEGQIWFFVLATLITVIFAFYLYYTKKVKHIIGKSAITFVIAGGLGNLIDRIRLGYVVDMIELKFIDFAIFNVADIFITIGGILMAIYILFIYDNEK